MDKDYIKTFQELNNMQSKIASLFKDLLIERYHYKLNSDKLKKNLEKVSIEVKNLKKENETLQQGNKELKNVIHECLEVFRYLDFSAMNVMEDHKIALDTLKRILSQTNNVNSKPTETDVVKKEISLDGKEESASRCEISQDDIKKEIDAIKDLQFDTQFFDSVEINEEMKYLNENKSGMVLEKLFERKSCEAIENFEKCLFIKETEFFDEKNNLVGPEVQETVDPLTEVRTPKKNIISSPVFKDLNNLKQANLSGGVNCFDDSRLKINGKLFLKSSDLIISPLKRPDVGNSVSPKREMSSPKRIRKKMRFDSPKKSVNYLKKSNSREAEISVSGVRKLTQTLLNVECFKKKSPEKRNGEIFKNEGSAEPVKAYETKTLGDIDEDDVIIDSPKKFEQFLEDVKNKKTGHVLNEILVMTPSMTSDIDLDETYVSASVIKKCEMTGTHILEKIDEYQTPLKGPNRERGPDCDSVPFVYKREAVRSKMERMKLPGQACPECNKYYKHALGEDISPRKLKEILNKCSRHRDKNSPSLDDTPPGFWKPYLTGSVMTSPNKDDTIKK